jgi:Protein of unknown function (DUF1538)
MLQLLREKLIEVLQAVGPLAGLVCLLLVALVDAPAALIGQFVAGTALVVAGMVLLFAGLDLGILPMGRFVGAELPKRGSVALIVAVAFAIGFATTIAEPDVLVLASQVDRASEGAVAEHTVLYVIALGLAIFVALAMARVIYGFSMASLLSVAYAAMLVLSCFAPAQFVALAFDSGSVTTGVLTAPVVIAMAIGVSSVLAGRSPVSDGFGLLGFASVGPIIAVLLMGMLPR